MSPKTMLTLVIFALFAATPLVTGVDQTLEERTFGADVADAVVRRITRTGIFPDDQNIFRRIGFTETRFGEDPKTYRPNYYGGIWQVDEAYFNLTKDLTFPADIYQQIQTRWGIDWSSVEWTDLLKPFYSGLASRLFIQHLVNIPQNHAIPGTVNEQADYWVAHYRVFGSAPDYIRQVRALESDVVCEGMMDICIVLDGSNSIGATDFEKAKGFVADLVQSFSLDTTRVAFVTYGDIAYEIFDFQHSLNDDEMDDIIRNASYPNANTNTPAGLLMAVDFYQAIGSRNGVPQVIATFTDGLHNRGNLPAALMDVRNASLVSFSIGIGSDIDYAELLQISLLQPKRVFMLNDYDALAEFLYQMNSATCEVPQQPALGTEQSGQLNPDERRYFRYEFPEEDGAGIKIDIQSTGEGQLSGWYSYTEATPNSAVNDGEIQPGSISIPPPPKRRSVRQEEDDELPALYITLQCGEGEDRGEYVILAEKDDFQESPATTEVIETTPVVGDTTPTEPETMPTELPTEPETMPTEPETMPTELPTEPETMPTEPETMPTELPTEPETMPTEPETMPTEPPTEPETMPTEPPTEPETTPTEGDTAPTTTLPTVTSTRPSTTRPTTPRPSTPRPSTSRPPTTNTEATPEATTRPPSTVRTTPRPTTQLPTTEEESTTKAKGSILNVSLPVAILALIISLFK